MCYDNAMMHGPTEPESPLLSAQHTLAAAGLRAHLSRHAAPSFTPNPLPTWQHLPAPLTQPPAHTCACAMHASSSMRSLQPGQPPRSAPLNPKETPPPPLPPPPPSAPPPQAATAAALIARPPAHAPLYVQPSSHRPPSQSLLQQVICKTLPPARPALLLRQHHLLPPGTSTSTCTTPVSMAKPQQQTLAAAHSSAPAVLLCYTCSHLSSGASSPPRHPAPSN